MVPRRAARSNRKGKETAGVEARRRVRVDATYEDCAHAIEGRAGGVTAGSHGRSRSVRREARARRGVLPVPARRDADAHPVAHGRTADGARAGGDPVCFARPALYRRRGLVVPGERPVSYTHLSEPTRL